jgi:hypothetical protein
MYRIFYIMSEFLSTAYLPFRSATTAIPEVESRVRSLEGSMRMTVLVASLVAVASCDQVKNLHGGNPHAAVSPHAEQAGTTTVDLQGGSMTCDHPMVRGFYDISLKAFSNGPEKVDLPAYKEKTFAFMRISIQQEGGTAEDAEGWIDHVKDIPRQMIGIVKDDPKVLESCANFSIALSGPP